MIEQKIQKLVDDMKPYLAADNGFIEFIKYVDNIVYLKLSGNCLNCQIEAPEELRQGFVKYLKEEIPEIDDVVMYTL